MTDGLGYPNAIEYQGVVWGIAFEVGARLSGSCHSGIPYDFRHMGALLHATPRMGWCGQTYALPSHPMLLEERVRSNLCGAPHPMFFPSPLVGEGARRADEGCFCTA